MPFEAIAPWRELWVYLSATPLFSLTITLAVYLVWEWVHRRAGLHPLLNPVAWSIATLGALLLGSGLPYPAYFAGAQFIHFLLGPATVALAIPLVLAMTFACMYYLGIGLHKISLGALVLALGLLVDDAIIAVE